MASCLIRSFLSISPILMVRPSWRPRILEVIKIMSPSIMSSESIISEMSSRGAWTMRVLTGINSSFMRVL